MNRANAPGLEREKAIYKGNIGVRRIEIDINRVATWTLIFTNMFFVSYFFAKLFQWI